MASALFAVASSFRPRVTNRPGATSLQGGTSHFSSARSFARGVQQRQSPPAIAARRPKAWRREVSFRSAPVPINRCKLGCLSEDDETTYKERVSRRQENSTTQPLKPIGLNVATR